MTQSATRDQSPVEHPPHPNRGSDAGAPDAPRPAEAAVLRQQGDDNNVRPNPAGSVDADAVEDEVQAENRQRVERMSRVEIEEAHDELKRLFSPESLRFLQKKAALKKSAAAAAAAPGAVSGDRERRAQDPNQGTHGLPTHEPSSVPSAAPAPGTNKSPVNLTFEARSKGWVNMSEVEEAKLRWTTDVSPDEREEELRRNPIRKTEVRFDLAGRIVPLGADVATTAGLHHHAEFPELPGYVRARSYYLPHVHARVRIVLLTRTREFSLSYLLTYARVVIVLLALLVSLLALSCLVLSLTFSFTHSYVPAPILRLACPRCRHSHSLAHSPLTLALLCQHIVCMFTPWSTPGTR
jgi:hypothetical protein